MRWILLLLLCFLLTTQTSGVGKRDGSRPFSSPREDVNFDFAWRFYLGNFSNWFQCEEDAFPTNLSTVQCLGLKSSSANTANDCRDLCCMNVMCAIWQFADDQGCWVEVGTNDNCSRNHSSSDWVGGGRPIPAKPPPPAKSGPTSRDYDDSSWELVDTPHDGLITGTYTQDGPEKHAYLPTNITWYRKHFNLPEDWKGQSIWVYFEGVFRASLIYLNGQQLLYHDSGYTSFSVRLDNATNVLYGDGEENENVIVVRADATQGSGWWYEGGGIYRHNHLVSTSPVHLVVNGVYGAFEVKSNISFHDKSLHTSGMFAEAAMLYVSAEVVNDQSSGSQSVEVRFTLFDQGGKMIGSTTTASMSAASGKAIEFVTNMTVSSVELWSINRPYLYTLQTEVISDSTVIDAVNTSVGARQTRWDPQTGFYLNNVHFTWRGFNDHNDFTGVGIAVPDRVNLFRGQSMRAAGGNAWRMSHNPPIPVLLDILDRVGVVVWDENRQFGDSDIWVDNQRDMVKRDRNHPSVMVWSFCNEAGCDLSSDEQAVGQEFKDVSKDEDKFRPVSANQNGHIGGGLSSVIDVQGFSHRPGSTFDSYHKEFPNKPLIGSECCSCRTQRGEDFTESKQFTNFNADCNQEQTGYELDRKFVVGCMVWTLFDYYGEPTPFGWPMVSSSFGSIDLAGFAKASAYWYRAWWLYSSQHNQSSNGDFPMNPPSLVDPDATPLEENTHDGYLIHIVEHWEPRENATTRLVHVYTNAPMAELFVNGKSQGVQQLSWQGWAQWNVTFSPGNISANALSSEKQVLASHTVLTAGAAVKIVAHVDVPSEETQTGTALVLDGQDAGMVRAAIVDSNGRVVPSASHNVSFQVVSGPGRIIGVGNGDPSCHEPNHASWRSAYHGLARAIVQVTENSATPEDHRHRLLQIDAEGGVRTRIVPPGVHVKAPESIVVEASAPGLGSSMVTIPVSTDIGKHSVLSIAEKL